MGAQTKIEWTNHTWNPWYGCTQVSPACDRCYAMVMMDHRYQRVKWGHGQERKRTSVHNWNEPLRWQRAAAAAGRTETVFCLSLGDIWDNEVHPEWRRQAFSIMRATPNLIYLLLSKRIGNAVGMALPAGGLPANAALGATMANQEEYDRDRLKLQHAKQELDARFSFASIEPMLGPVILDNNAPDWIIVGGESGHKPRRMDLDWARSLRDQCVLFKRPFFFKQTTGKASIPPDLMVRQFPWIAPVPSIKPSVEVNL